MLCNFSALRQASRAPGPGPHPTARAAVAVSDPLLQAAGGRLLAGLQFSFSAHNKTLQLQ